MWDRVINEFKIDGAVNEIIEQPLQTVGEHAEWVPLSNRGLQVDIVQERVEDGKIIDKAIITASCPQTGPAYISCRRKGRGAVLARAQLNLNITSGNSKIKPVRRAAIAKRSITLG